MASGWNLWVWLECIVWLVVVVVRRYNTRSTYAHHASRQILEKQHEQSCKGS